MLLNLNYWWNLKILISVLKCVKWLWFNPHLPSGPIHPYQLEESISNFRAVWGTFSFLFCFESILVLTNNEDPDQMPHFVASDLGLHCLPMSQKWDARLICVLRCLIWVCTVCLCPKNGMLGLYGLKRFVNDFQELTHFSRFHKIKINLLLFQIIRNHWNV